MDPKRIKHERIELKQKNHERIREAVKSLQKFLNQMYVEKLFHKNRAWFFLGMGISFTALLITAFMVAAEPSGVLFIFIWLTFWTIGVFFLIRQVVLGWRKLFFGGGIAAGASALFLTLFSIPFVGGEVFGLWQVSKLSSVWMIPLLAAVAGVNYALFRLLKRPTMEGQKVRDQIEGFKMYLSAAEGDVLRWARQPPKTPKLFEKYLPYALALGVETSWAEQFSHVLADAGQALGDGVYQPTWYHGSRRWSDVSSTNFTARLGSSLAGAIASSSTAPGSSSGGGGSGSSGGGGGGGGGGGW